MKLSILSLFTLILALAPARADSRTWTDTSGRKIQAEMVSTDGSHVELKLANGKISKVPLASLSSDDRDFIAKPTSADPASAAEGNFNQPWPRESRLTEDYEVEAILDGPDEFIFETPHFRFISDTKIGKGLIKKLSTIFEATYEANKALPLGNRPWFIKDVKFEARLFEKKDDYLKSGAPAMSAGVYIATGNGELPGTVLVPFESLGVQKVGSIYMHDSSKSSNTLIHEITHQMMSEWVKRPAWFCEGSAEYVALSPYSNGKFNFNTNKRTILMRVTDYDRKTGRGRAMGKDISVGCSLKTYMTMPYDLFIKCDPNINYGLAPLITYYFYHEDGQGDAARIKAYVQALEARQSEADCLKLLLDGRTWDELAKEITTFWKRSGITITFTPSE